MYYQTYLLEDKTGAVKDELMTGATEMFSNNLFSSVLQTQLPDPCVAVRKWKMEKTGL